MTEPLTDEELRIFALSQAGGDVERARVLVEFVRPSVQAPPVEAGAPGRRYKNAALNARLREMETQRLDRAEMCRRIAAEFGVHFNAAALRQRLRYLGCTRPPEAAAAAHAAMMREARRAATKLAAE